MQLFICKNTIVTFIRISKHHQHNMYKKIHTCIWKYKSRYKVGTKFTEVYPISEDRPVSTCPLIPTGSQTWVHRYWRLCMYDRIDQSKESIRFVRLCFEEKYQFKTLNLRSVLDKTILGVDPRLIFYHLYLGRNQL